MKKKKLFGNTFYIGLLSFFGGISQDIFLPVLPLYLANVLHFEKSFIGLSEGIVTASASIFKIIAGIFSDRFQKRKPIIFAGYFLSFISRPLLAFLTGPTAILTLRFLDGVGKGIKDSPKDALIADSTKIETRGKSFGIVRAFDTLGSVVGPILLFVLFYFFQSNPKQYHFIFLLTALPLIFTLLIILIFVKDISPLKKFSEVKLPALPKSFYLFLAIVLLFSLGNSSDTFLILRAQNVGVGILAIPLVYALFNSVYAFFSVPLGSLSDKIGREKVILLGWVFYSVSYLGFGFSNQPYQIWLLFAFYGLYYATTEGVAKALVADLVPSLNRGKAYGIYNASVGLTTLPASFIAGFLWDKFNPATPFFFGAILSFSASIMLLLFTTFKKA